MHTILVGDHEELSLILKVDHLTEQGYEVVAAGNGSELEARFREDPRRFDLVVAESWILYGISLSELGECVKRLHPPPRLIITADFDPPFVFHHEEALRGLCSDLLVRPFSLQDLSGSVGRVLAQRDRS